MLTLKLIHIALKDRDSLISAQLDRLTLRVVRPLEEVVVYRQLIRYGVVTHGVAIFLNRSEMDGVILKLCDVIKHGVPILLNRTHAPGEHGKNAQFLDPHLLVTD
jgi:hypothetical protein